MVDSRISFDRDPISNGAGAGSVIGVRLDPDLLSALDRYAKEHGELTRPQALLAALRDWATAHGYMQSADEGTRPEDLNASNDD